MARLRAVRPASSSSRSRGAVFAGRARPPPPAINNQEQKFAATVRGKHLRAAQTAKSCWQRTVKRQPVRLRRRGAKKKATPAQLALLFFGGNRPHKRASKLWFRCVSLLGKFPFARSKNTTIVSEPDELFHLGSIPLVYYRLWLWM